MDINTQFDHQYYCLLYKSNRAAAEKYIQKFQWPKVEEGIVAVKNREMMTKFLKDNGVRVFPNYKDETIEKMYNEKKEQLQVA